MAISATRSSSSDIGQAAIKATESRESALLNKVAPPEAASNAVTAAVSAITDAVKKSLESVGDKS